MAQPPKQDGLSIEFRAESVLQMMAALEGVSMESLHEDLGEENIQMIRERIREGVDVFGVPFEPIKRYVYRMGTIARVRKPGDKPLKVGLGSPPFINSFEKEASPDEVLVGTTKDFAKFISGYPDNNQGPRPVQPLREFMGVELDKDYARLIGVAEDQFYTLAEVQGNLV